MRHSPITAALAAALITASAFAHADVLADTTISGKTFIDFTSIDQTRNGTDTANAGTGKTRVLTERARHLLSSGVPDAALLLVAFNKRAQLEMQERTALEGELVKMGRETPATVKLLAALSLADLRSRIAAFRGSPAPATLGRVGHPSTVTAGDSVAEISPYEAERVTAYAEKLRRDFGDKARPVDEVLKRYIAHKEQQVVGCKAGGMRAILATISSTSSRVMVFFCLLLGRMRCAAPASSITSMALSGSRRSPICLTDNSTAALIASPL